MRPIDADKLPEHKFPRESAKESDYMRGWNDAIDTIVDNAPTVESEYAVVKRLEARQRGYEEGYHMGMKIGKTLNSKIKHGEWITTERGYECSECGALHSDDYPFCHMCGVYMGKGDRE